MDSVWSDTGARLHGPAGLPEQDILERAGNIMLLKPDSNVAAVGTLPSLRRWAKIDLSLGPLHAGVAVPAPWRHHAVAREWHRQRFSVPVRWGF
jgi:hypothetical protein